MYHNGQLVMPHMGSGNEESHGNLLQPYTDSPNTSSGKPLHIMIRYTIKYIQKGKHDRPSYDESDKNACI